MNPNTQQIVEFNEKNPSVKELVAAEGFEPLPTRLEPDARRLIRWAKKRRKKKRKTAQKARKRNRK